MLRLYNEIENITVPSISGKKWDFLRTQGRDAAHRQLTKYSSKPAPHTNASTRPCQRHHDSKARRGVPGDQKYSRVMKCED
jgi:hypothetical protein